MNKNYFRKKIRKSMTKNKEIETTIKSKYVKLM